MKIAVDFREAVKPSRAGKGEYVYELIKAWLQVIDKDVELILLTGAGQKINLPKGRWRQKSFSRGWLWHKLVWLWLEFARPVDFYFATTSFIVPAFLRSTPVITTIFDFTVWRHLYSKTKVNLLEKILAGPAMRFSRHLIAISEFTKQEAVKLFKIAPSKIDVIYLGAGSQYRPFKLSEEQKRSLHRKYNLPSRFILYLGTLEPRKNILNIIRAFQQVKPEIKNTKLVLAGSWGWQANEIKQAIKTHEVIHIGYVEYSDKPAIYNLASVFVFPSYYEGFGLPPLEAMACGIPTIVSDAASLPEIVEDAAIVVAPNDAEGMARQIKEILSNTIFSRRLHAKGIERAKQFNWKDTAQQTQAVFKKQSW
ncbi:glycosyltransferase family 1 protein [candidate division Kazan bacterium]|uniref:Glycosyltransferase family 1 protein n=1 Tax=candidate division Kazan bacterium TaxID=2202143 RepID=A0A420ZDF7_UNCK3|nr:MAG: glycosyltransferase family 1 protein [candidate division Kazan bacterium]